MAADSQPCTVVPITSAEDFKSHISSLPPACLAVIYFQAPWAPPCQQMSTVLDTLASTYSSATPPTISFLSLDAEEVSDVSEDYDVTQVPLVVLQKNGQVVETISGGNGSRVRQAIEKHVGTGAGQAALPPAQKVTKPAPSQTAEAPPTQTNGKHEANGETEEEDVNTKLANLVKAAPVMLFMKGTPSAPQCGFSKKTVAMLREKGVRYGFFNILADDEVRQGLKEYSDWPTFPQVYVGGEFVGGLDILKEEFENDPDFLKEYSVHKEAQAA